MMIRSLTRFAGSAALAVAIGALGCSSTVEDDAVTTDTGSEFTEAPVPRDGSGDGSSGDRRMLDFETVYFDFDSYEIRSDARPALRENADAISAGAGGAARITVEGHCDERGSTEYNLALGERRANAVKRYLVDLGVPSSRLRTVSFGEDRPAVQGHDESAWRYNRRSEFSLE